MPFFPLILSRGSSSAASVVHSGREGKRKPASHGEGATASPLAMAEPSPKRLKGGLPFCTVHRQQGRAPGKLVKQNFPPPVEEGLCGVTGALLEAAAVFHALGEIFSDSSMALPNVSKFFLDQAKEGRETAEALIQYQHVRGGMYCSRIIPKTSNMLISSVAPALEVALVQWKTVASYFEELYALSIKYSDPCTASTIKKQFLRPTSKKIKLMGDLVTNAHRLRNTQDGRGDLGNYLIDRWLEELKIGPESEAHCDLCVPLQGCTGVAKELLLLQWEFPPHRTKGRSKYSELYCFSGKVCQRQIKGRSKNGIRLIEIMKHPSISPAQSLCLDT